MEKITLNNKFDPGQTVYLLHSGKIRELTVTLISSLIVQVIGGVKTSYEHSYKLRVEGGGDFGMEREHCLYATKEELINSL